MPCLSHTPLLDHFSFTWLTIQITQLLIMQLSPPPITYSLLSTPFPNILRLCSSLTSQKVSHQYKTKA
jgi:hypothetical protein